MSECERLCKKCILYKKPTSFGDTAEKTTNICLSCEFKELNPSRRKPKKSLTPAARDQRVDFFNKKYQ